MLLAHFIVSTEYHIRPLVALAGRFFELYPEASLLFAAGCELFL